MDLPVSIAVGKRLFFHIVNSATVATKLQKWMKTLELPGEVDYLPLDKLYVEDFNYPQSKNAAPLINHVVFPDELELAYRVRVVNVIKCTERSTCLNDDFVLTVFAQ